MTTQHLAPEQAQTIFDAARTISAAFEHAGWTWGGGPRPEAWPAHTPDAREIEKRIHGLIDTLHDNPDIEPGWSSSTGRIHVQLGDEGEVLISLDIAVVPEALAWTKDGQRP